MLVANRSTLPPSGLGDNRRAVHIYGLRIRRQLDGEHSTPGWHMFRKYHSTVLVPISAATQADRVRLKIFQRGRHIPIHTARRCRPR
jgi:hypothetical protein